jgi:hypothetical protein
VKALVSVVVARLALSINQQPRRHSQILKVANLLENTRLVRTLSHEGAEVACGCIKGLVKVNAVVIIIHFILRP